MPDAEAFSLLAVPGVTVNKWSRTWSERLPEVELRLIPTEAAQATAALLSTQADAGLVRLPVDMDVFHAITLYTEATVVVIPRDHELADASEVTLADLAGETLLQPLDDVLVWTVAPSVSAHRPATTAAAVELVAASAGVVIVPQSLARLYHRRDLTYLTVTDAPSSSVALVWMRDQQSSLVEEMIGIVRGRTANSSRGPSQPTAEPPARKPTEGRRKPASGKPGSRSGGPNPRTSQQRRGR